MIRPNALLFVALVAALILSAGVRSSTPAHADTTSPNTAPVATIEAPTSDATWAVDEDINFSGHATDEEDGELPADNLRWDVQVLHCADFSYTRCPPHYWETYEGVASGQYNPPYHELPTYMKITLTATDSEGLQRTDFVDLYPRTVELSFRSEPSGLVLYVGENDGRVTPFTHTDIVGSTMSITAPSLQTLPGIDYEFLSWSDGGEISHEITAGEQPSTYTATYQQPDTTAPGAPLIGSPSDGTVTSDNTPNFSGTAEAGSTVELFDNGTSLGTTPADGSGGWSFTPGDALGDGEHRITAKATDPADNQSAASPELLMTVDTVKPSTAASLPLANGAGWNNGDVTVALNATDNGGGSGVDRITYSVSGAQTISETDASGGSVDVLLNKEGTTTLTYHATDKAGNVADPKTLMVKIDKSAPTLDIDSSDGSDGITPDRREIRVSRNIEPTATFSDEMDAASLATAVKLDRWNTSRKAWRPVPVGVSVEGDSATLDPYPTDPTRLLAAKKKFKVTVTPGAKNLADIPLGSNKSWTFTTGR